MTRNSTGPRQDGRTSLSTRRGFIAVASLGAGYEAPERFLSSDLVTAAVAATRAVWEPPALGIVSFIDACTAPGHSEILPNTDDSSMLVVLPFVPIVRPFVVPPGMGNRGENGTAERLMYAGVAAYTGASDEATDRLLMRQSVNVQR